jgi:phosphoglycolate phosphatase
LNRDTYFFDLDGTLCDPSAGLTACTRYALESLGRPVPADAVLATFIGPPLRPMFSTLLESRDAQLIERAVGLFRERYRERFLAETHLYEDIPDMLARVRRCARAMFVATSKPTTFAERIVEHLGVARYFDGVYGTGLDGRFDDKAHLLAHALESRRIVASDAAMIGDRAVDVAAARVHGMPTIGVLWGYGSREELDSAGAAPLCATPHDLADYLSGTLQPGMRE